MRRLPWRLPKGMLCGLLGVVAQSAAAQALDVAQLSNGTAVLQVAQPLADATSVAWLAQGEAGEQQILSLSSGKLTLAADLETVFSGSESDPAPPVIAVVGGGAGAGTDQLLGRLLAGRAPLSYQRESPYTRSEGGLEKRLGSPGSEASLRLEVPLPSPATWQRTALEVLWELLPELLGAEVPGLLDRIEGDLGVLEARTDPELGELRLGKLRLALAKLASAPRLDEERVGAAANRLLVRRLAELEEHPRAAELLVSWWLRGGTDAVRERLFGLRSASAASIALAVREWLARHPGSAVLILPPQVLNPRFASGPQQLHLASDLAVAILERPATPLSVLCVRPVLQPDADGMLSATVLARLATEIRSREDPPGWIRVRTRPATLELAAAADDYAELCEALQAALHRIGEDQQPVSPAAGSARRRALRLMAAQLGLGDESELTPAHLLRLDNLALGMVVPDGEAAIEALRKLLSFEQAGFGRVPLGQTLVHGQRTREAAPGSISTILVALQFDPDPGQIITELVAGLLRERAAEVLPEVTAEVLQPLLPGRTVLLLLVEAEQTLDELEEHIRASWRSWLAPVGEEGLTPHRRRLAAELSTAASGAVGRARACAAVAAGAAVWRGSAELELEALSTSPEDLAKTLERLRDWGSLTTTGAGRVDHELLQPDAE